MTWSLLIRGGSLVDGSGAPARAADVAVEGDRIVAIGPALAGHADRVIDARGKVVAPASLTRTRIPTSSISPAPRRNPRCARA